MEQTICVVTGAGRGLGRLIAERFARRGHAVLCTDLDGAAAEATATRIGGGAWSLAQDVRDPDSHARVADAAMARGPVAVWVNNAGVLAVGPSWEHAAEEVRRMVEVNVLGVIWGAHAAIRAMRERGGLVVNVASLSSLVPAPGVAVYAATKHAVLGHTIAMQGDLDRAGVRIRLAAVCPDAMETDMVRNVAHHDASSVLYSAGDGMLRAEDVADEIARLEDRPRLVTILPRGRGALAHLVRPFPAFGLKMLARFEKLGRQVRARRGLA